uniref:Uncharacterized protein n=1 Tax=Tanacetum cinerariifolium TaxID=118510 RepID=A0A6L2MT40_TANCI|nr:hypothetical protein [Tanacetum cinerariifolium]
MILNVEQLKKQLDKEDFQEIGSMAAFNAILEFRDTLIQHLESVNKSIDERVQLKREYDSWDRIKRADTSSSSGNDAHDDGVDIRPIYDEEPMAKVQTTAEIDIFAIRQRHTEQPEFNNEGEVVQNAKECHDTVNSRAKVPSHKTTNRNKPVEPISVPNKQERQIPTGHRFSIQKTSAVQKKTMTPRSCLRWKPTGKIFKIVGLRWVPTRRILTSSTTKVDSEPLNGSNAYITNQYECEQTIDVSAELGIHDHSNEPSSSKLVPKVVPPADKIATSRQELELIFHQHLTMLRDLPKDTPYLEIAVLRYDGDECDKGRMPTKIELTLEQSQQCVSNDVLVTIEGVEKLKRNVWIKGENKAAFPTLKAKTESIHMLSVFTKVNSGIKDKTSWT